MTASGDATLRMTCRGLLTIDVRNTTGLEDGAAPVLSPHRGRREAGARQVRWEQPDGDGDGPELSPGQA